MPEDLTTNPIRQQLRDLVLFAGLERDYHPTLYERGERLQRELTGICPAQDAVADFTIEKFVGGGFAGQVYRARLDCIDPALPSLEAGRIYKIKIIKPPSSFSLKFRNALYWIGYQGAFSAEVNHAGARAGALWQTLIRRGAKIRFGRADAVSEVYATFWDEGMRSFGEIAEWVEGRVWRLEHDDRYFERYDTEEADGTTVGPPEFLAKRQFMRDFVELLHEMGGPELARQYEWWTTKSQPNALKRFDGGDAPGDGLSAIDFRAGLTLLPFLPMSPGDVPLIWRGIRRGSWVQFDRGDLAKLEGFIEDNAFEFGELRGALTELHQVETDYRASLPDVTHQGLRLITDRELRECVVSGTVDAWAAKGDVDDAHAEKLRKGGLTFTLFWCLGILPFLGKQIRRLLCHDRFRLHLRKCFTSFTYLWKTLTALRVEALIDWHRTGRVSDARALKFANAPVRFWTHRILFGLLPAKWHRFLTDGRYAWQTVRFAVTHPWQLLFNPAVREKWLSDQINEGRKEGMLTDEEADDILERIKEPFIQKYLKSCAVHVCTLPVTQIVSVAVAIYAAMTAETKEDAAIRATAVLALFQVMPLSPGSLVRGLYAFYAMVRDQSSRRFKISLALLLLFPPALLFVIILDRRLKRYRIAVLLSFWKYIGYLSFPIQMVAEYPALARFMAGRWATSAVHIVPVFGESGALLEHTVFDLFFNLPLTLRRTWTENRERWAPRLRLALVTLLLILGTLLGAEFSEEIKSFCHRSATPAANAPDDPFAVKVERRKTDDGKYQVWLLGTSDGKQVDRRIDRSLHTTGSGADRSAPNTHSATQ